MGARSKFQQRHYEALAKVMQDAAPPAHYGNGEVNTFAKAQWERTRTKLAEMFSADNARFNVERFERACVPGANVKARK